MRGMRAWHTIMLFQNQQRCDFHLWTSQYTLVTVVLRVTSTGSLRTDSRSTTQIWKMGRLFRRYELLALRWKRSAYTNCSARLKKRITYQLREHYFAGGATTLYEVLQEYFCALPDPYPHTVECIWNQISVEENRCDVPFAPLISQYTLVYHRLESNFNCVIANK